MVGPPLRVRLEDELRHLVLMARKIGPLVKLQHELANPLVTLADFELAAAGLLRDLGILGKQRDVSVGVTGVQRPAVAGVELIDLDAILDGWAIHCVSPRQAAAPRQTRREATSLQDS